MNRRTFLKMAAALGAYGLPGAALLDSVRAHARPIGRRKPFDYAWLKGHAHYLAGRPYRSRKGNLPASLKHLSWDDYQAIRFRPDRSLWRDKGSDFHLQFFHLGLYFQAPVIMYEVIDGQAQELGYDPSYFRYSGKEPLGKLPADLGYAGLRIQFRNDFKRDVAAFLGASYFRAVGDTMQFGMSARGLAIDTALPGGEEFPDFTAFWLVKPKPGDAKLTVYALLDSSSTTGAYAFDLFPGHDMVMNISAALYPRKPIERLGLAPLTSMYLAGENDRRMDYDWRPEIHDSDGLSIWTGAGERIWRPLVNPSSIQANSFFDRNPRGFGLLTRATAESQTGAYVSRVSPDRIALVNWMISAMVAGTAAVGGRITRTLEHKRVNRHPINGFAAEASSAAVIAGASLLGIPVSTTHNISAAIMGVGAAKRLNAIRWTIVERMVWAWVFTIPVSGAIAYALPPGAAPMRAGSM